MSNDSIPISVHYSSNEMRLQKDTTKSIAARMFFPVRCFLQSGLRLRCRTYCSPDAHLIIAPIFLGDLFMLSPFIQGLRIQHPNGKLVLLCRPELEDLGHIFSVDHVISAKRPDLDARNRILDASPEGYEKCYVFFAGAWLRTLSTIPIQRIISFPDPKGRNNHLIDKLVSFPSGLTPLPQFTLWAFDCHHPNTLPLDRWSPRPGVAVLHIGARSIARHFTLWQTVQIISALSERGLSTIILTGESSEIVPLDQISDNLPPGSIQLIDLRGKARLKDMPEVLSEVEIAICVDTGIAHLAKAIGTPTLVLLGQSQGILFGMDNNFSRSRHFAVNDLTCRTKKTLHGIKADWIISCNVNACPLETRPCLPDTFPPVLYKLLDDLLIETRHGNKKNPAHKEG